MSLPQAGLQRAGLLRAMTEIALEVQKAQSVADMLRIAGAGLESIGFDIAIISLEDANFWVRYLTARDALVELGHLTGVVVGERQQLPQSAEMLQVLAVEAPVYLEDFAFAVQVWMDQVHAAPEVKAKLHTALKKRAVLAPLNVRESMWGGIVLMHDELDADDTSVLRLFSLQLGSAIEMGDKYEQLARRTADLELRTAELELVHQLAVADAGSDVARLCERGLEAVCRSTRSTAGCLHRYDAEKNEFVMVGNAWGYAGALIAQFQRFVPRERSPVWGASQSLAVANIGPARALVRAEGFNHLAVVPLGEGQHRSVLWLARALDEPYSEKELRTAEILGTQMASLLERVRLFDEAQRLYRDLKKSYDELARTQAELVRHERLAALGELAAVMAHEVRNPLGVIFNSLTTLRRLLKPTGDAEMLLDIVGEEADRLNRIVGDLLDFVRPYELVKKPVAVEPVIASAVDSASKSLHGNVRVVTDLPELPPFPVDAHLLKQVVVNLVVNAVQAMPKGGTIEVRASMAKGEGGPTLVIEVRDEGIGLTPRAAEKMFQPFFTTKATGTGLGLAVVKRIVDAHQGEVSAAPNADKGTTFTIRLPSILDRSSLTPPMVEAARRG